MKKTLVIFILLISVFQFAVAQQNSNVISWKSKYSLYTFLMQSMHQQYEHRHMELQKALLNPQNMNEYVTLVRERLKKVVGDLPQKTPLNPQITGTIKGDGYRIEKLVLESRPNFHLTSNLYIPNAPQSKKPAVLLFCGHEMTSKATESYQKTALLFVKNGFVVLAIDPVSQGERMQLVDSLGNPFTKSSTNEHTILNAGCNLMGTSIAAVQLFDNIRAMDYLCSRAEVDTSRIGCIGNSGGGTQTVFFAAFDPRIKLAAPCSFVASRERNFELTYAADGCQHFPFEGKYGLEISDFLVAFSPKPLLLLAARFDFVDYTGTSMVADELKKVYTTQGQKEKFSLFTYDDGHGISRPKREAAVAWFKKWLCNDSSKVIEKGLTTHDEKTLRCTEKQQVYKEFKDETSITDINIAQAKRAATNRQKFMSLPLDIVKEKISDLLGIKLKYSPVETELVETKNLGNYQLSKLIIRRAGEIPFPCLQYQPLKINQDTKIKIVLDENGKAAVVRDSAAIIKDCQNNNIVLIPDLSGLGEMADLAECNDPKYWNKEYRCAMAAIHIGKTLVGQRVIDLISLLQYAKKDFKLKNPSVQIWANGLYVPVVLHAAVFSSEITSINIPKNYESYLSWLQHPTNKNAYSSLVPKVLNYYDLTDLTEWLGKERAIVFRE